MNPNVFRSAHRILSGRDNVHIIETAPYRRMVALMRRARPILTNSGGIQEEAPSFGVPVLVMREKTARPEAVESRVARLAGTSASAIEAKPGPCWATKRSINR